MNQTALSDRNTLEGFAAPPPVLPNSRSQVRKARSDSEQGYALVALLAVMALLALFAMAVTSNLQQQAQREREKEAIFRGEQVAQAIRAYYQFKGRQGVNSLPTSMDQLLEGVPRGTKKLQILRVEAARDPLSKTGEWRLIGPTSQDFARFVSSLTVYAGGVPPPPKTDFAALAGLIPRMTDVLNAQSSSTAPGGDDTSANADGPFLGVASRSQRNSVINYYGIDRHDEWIFTPLFR